MTRDISSAVHGTVIDQAITAAIEPQQYELVRNLGRVLGIQPEHQVLVLSNDDALQHALANEFGCDVTLLDDVQQQLPFADAQFDAVIVARAVLAALPPFTRELARVTKQRGTLGMIVLNVHADYVAQADDALQSLHGAMLRPAAAYRAVLAESGWTAFVSTPRQGELLRATRNTYRQYLLEPAAEAAPRVAPQALQLLATDGVAVTLITAEQAL